jgi:hypothetical protein
MKSLIKKLLNESLVAEFYGKKVIEPITKRFGDASDDMINKLAVAFLFRQWFGDVMTYQSKQEFDGKFQEWYNLNIGELIKTREFVDNKPLAEKYLDAYVNNIVSLGDAAKPFSFKNIEGTFVDLVNNNNWVKDEGGLANSNNIYKPNSDDILYEDDDVLILNTDTKAKCVMYGRGESWCITKPDLNYYNTYRLSYGATPYFVLQKNVKGDEHKFVIMNYGRGGYAIADRSNSGNRSGGQNQTMGWYQIEQELPNLSGLERYFPYREISDDERKYAELLENIKANYSDEYGFNDADDSLQKVIDKYSNNLVINGARITSGDFIRDLAANRMDFSVKQIKSLRKETVDSLIESGYFVNKYISESDYSDVFSQTQINRIIKLKIDNDSILHDFLIGKLPENLYKEYFRLRLEGHNTSKTASYSTLISEKSLDPNEVDVVKKLFPDAKISTDRFDLTTGHDLYTAIYIDPRIANSPEGRRNLGELDNFSIYRLLETHPELIKYLGKLPEFQRISDWRLTEIINSAPKYYKGILDAITDEVRKQKLIESVMYGDFLPYFIRDGVITIDTPEKFKNVKYSLFSRGKGKSFVYKPELLKFVDARDYELSELLINQPTLFKYLDYKLDDMSNYDLSDIISKNPKTLQYIPERRIDEMSEYTIYTTIYKNPKLAPLLVKKINMGYVIDLLSNVPKSIPQMPESTIRQLTKYDMISILTYNKKNKKEQYKYLEPIIDANMPQDKEYILSRI